jgi:ABC-type arginine transport system permease subunit
VPVVASPVVASPVEVELVASEVAESDVASEVAESDVAESDVEPPLVELSVPAEVEALVVVFEDAAVVSVVSLSPLSSPAQAASEVTQAAVTRRRRTCAKVRIVMGGGR